VRVAFGTAHLFLRPGDEAASQALLLAALALPVHGVDTAPSYGHGRSEARVGTALERGALAAGAARPLVTTKVGLEPTPDQGVGARAGSQVVRRLPPGLEGRLRARLGRPAGGLARGVLDAGLVRASVARSLRRLGHVDRLVLHEARPEDVTDEVLGVLAGHLAAGDVGALGVATQDSLTAAVVARAPELLTVAHVTASVLREPVPLPPSVTVRVGHGLLGPAGADLRRLRGCLAADAGLAERWRAAVAGTAWEGPDGLAHAVLGLAAARGSTDVIVATSRSAGLAGTVAAAGQAPPAGHAVSQALDALMRAATTGTVA